MIPGSMFFKVITTIAVVIVTVFAAPAPGPRRTSGGMAVPLTRYSSSLDAKKPTNPNMLKSHVTLHTASEGNMRALRRPDMKRGSAQSSEAHDSYPGVDLYHETHIWYGTISIGTPAKSFTVEFDTGSSDLFVPASDGNEDCRSHHNLWDTASSRTATTINEDFNIEFEDGSIAAGKQYTDNVTIAGFTADTQTIGSATTYSSRFQISEFASDGLLGLAFPSLSVYHGRSPLLYTLFNEGKLPQPVFSFMFTASGGELYVGGTNEALYIDSSLVFIPVTSAEYWELKIDNIKVNGKIVLTDVPAIVDTGSYYFWGDPFRVSILHKADGGQAFGDGYYTFPCSSFPSVTFTIGGKPFLVPANALRLDQVESGSSRCFSAIVAANMDDDSWTLGAIFLQLFYTVFDFGSQPRVGFAMLANS